MTCHLFHPCCFGGIPVEGRIFTGLPTCVLPRDKRGVLAFGLTNPLPLQMNMDQTSLGDSLPLGGLLKRGVHAWLHPPGSYHREAGDGPSVTLSLLELSGVLLLSNPRN